MIYYTMDVPVVTEGKAEYTATLTAYIPKNGLEIPLNNNRPAVVIFPGGGYGFTYDGEAEPIALNFTAQGICCFILRYSVAPAVFPQALVEGMWCVRYVREHAGEYGINPKNISVLGFSAGGHLCASVGTLWEKDIWKKYLSGEGSDYRPDKLVLCYPVITSDLTITHEGSFRNLLGDRFPDPELMAMNSLEKQVTGNTPPSFLWQTWEDGAVPVQNSLLFAAACVDHHVPIEMHIYPHGGHGSCTGDQTSMGLAFGQAMTLNEWLGECARFVFDESLLPG